MVSLQRVYLDQCHWVELARAYYGKTNDPVTLEVLDLVLASADQGLASYPISAAHYLETYRRGEPGARQRLGSFMAKVSRLHSMTGPVEVLRAEVTRGFQAACGAALDPEPRVFGVGHCHAFGLAVAEYRQWAFWDTLVARTGEEPLVKELEVMMLAGPSERLPVGDMQLPKRAYDQRQLDFELETVRALREHGHSADLARRLVLTQEAGDVVPVLNELAETHRVDLGTLLGNDEKMTAFMYSLPAKGAISALRISSHENPNIKRELNDLTDLTALGMAGAYCHVVIAEKHWGGLMKRTPERFGARVITKLRELPELLLR